MLHHTVVMVRGENKFAQKPALVGSTLLIPHEDDSSDPPPQTRGYGLKLHNLVQFAHCRLFSSMQLKENNALLTLMHKAFY